MEQVRDRDVLKAVLLQVLLNEENGLHIHHVYERIEESFVFPEQWYRAIPRGNGHDELSARGIDDWRSVPQITLVQMVQTEPQWQNEVRWARNDLRKDGLLDLSVPRGIWKLSGKGNHAVDELRQQLNPSERRIATPRPTSGKHRPHASKPSPSGLHRSRRESLTSTLMLMIDNMPIDDLELAVELVRAVRTRSVTDAVE